MYVVFWASKEGGKLKPNLRDFGSHELTLALETTQTLRKEGHIFVSLASADPNNTGKMGVSSPLSNYSWKKRR